MFHHWSRLWNLTLQVATISGTYCAHAQNFPTLPSQGLDVWCCVSQNNAPSCGSKLWYSSSQVAKWHRDWTIVDSGKGACLFWKLSKPQWKRYRAARFDEHIFGVTPWSALLHQDVEVFMAPSKQEVIGFFLFLLSYPTLLAKHGCKKWRISVHTKAILRCEYGSILFEDSCIGSGETCAERVGVV